MNDNTETIEKTPDNSVRAHLTGSHMFNVSLRGWIALLVVATVCVMSYRQLEIKEPLYTLAGLVVGFYFGQTKPKNQQS